MIDRIAPTAMVGSRSRRDHGVPGGAAVKAEPNASRTTKGSEVSLAMDAPTIASTISGAAAPSSRRIVIARVSAAAIISLNDACPYHSSGPDRRVDTYASAAILDRRLKRIQDHHAAAPTTTMFTRTSPRVT